MVRQTKVQLWRDAHKDNPEAWLQLVSVALSTDRTGEKIMEEYGFSWNAIRPDCVRLGYYKLKREAVTKEVNEKENEDKRFFIGDWDEAAEFVSRSVELDRSIRMRLEAFENKNKVYAKKYVLNQLLDEVLTKYGF